MTKPFLLFEFIYKALDKFCDLHPEHAKILSIIFRTLILIFGKGNAAATLRFMMTS